MSWSENQEAVKQLAGDPNARVMVFIDGQNLYKQCKRLFNYPLCHPHLLAEHLAGPRTKHLPRVRFYTGRPNQNIAGERKKARNLDRRLGVMRQCGIDVITRQLRYHWDWGHQEQLPRPKADVSSRTVELTPWQRPQEKGIDLVLGLDVIEFMLNDKYDVAIIVSLDRDLFEIPQAAKNLRAAVDRPVRIEAAVPVPEDMRRPKTLPHFDFTHQITRDVFELVRDAGYYASDDPDWQAPDPPRQLSDLDAHV